MKAKWSFRVTLLLVALVMCANAERYVNSPRQAGAEILFGFLLWWLILYVVISIGSLITKPFRKQRNKKTPEEKAQAEFAQELLIDTSFTDMNAYGKYLQSKIDKEKKANNESYIEWARRTRMRK